MLTRVLVPLGTPPKEALEAVEDHVQAEEELAVVVVAVWEFSLGVYLIAKGFRREASVFHQTRAASLPADGPVPAVLAA